MLSQVPTTAQKIEAKIQSYVGRFLQARNTLTNLLDSRDPAIRQKAQRLYKRQLELEPELKTNLDTIDKMKTGDYTFIQVAQVANFGREMTAHTKNVERFANGNKMSLVAGLGSNPILIVGGGVLALTLFMRRSRRGA